MSREKILITGATSGLEPASPPVRRVNLGAGTCAPRTLSEMPRHRITTASLLNDIERHRIDEATSRWEELSREFMQDDDVLTESETASAQRAG